MTCLFLLVESPSDLSRQSSRVLRMPLTRDGGFSDFGFWTLSDHKFINTLELKGVILAPITVSALRGHQIMIATDNTTVVAYIKKHGWNHSPTLLCLVVDLFLLLQTQDIAIWARNIPGCLNVKVLRDVGNSNTGHACLPQSTTCLFPSLCLQSRSLEHWR